MAKKKPANNDTLILPVSFGNVNIGDHSARIGVAISRGQLSVASAEKNLCGRRITGKILARSTGQANQASLPGADDDTEMEGVFDIASIGVSKKKITAGLTFSLASIDVATLAHFAKREGQVFIEDSEEIPEGEEGEE